MYLERVCPGVMGRRQRCADAQTRRGPGQPLTSRSYANNLKKYVAKARMRRVNIHQTRHIYTRIIFEDSSDLLETQSALDHESQATTRAYVHTVAVKKDKHNDK